MPRDQRSPTKRAHCLDKGKAIVEEPDHETCSTSFGGENNMDLLNRGKFQANIKDKRFHQKQQSRHSTSAAIDISKQIMEISNRDENQIRRFSNFDHSFRLSFSRYPEQQQLWRSRSSTDRRAEHDNFLNRLDDITVQNELIVVKKKKKKRLWDLKWQQKRFPCIFSLHIHSISGLSDSMNGLPVYVHWKRKDRRHIAKSSLVSHGYAEFDKILYQSCTIRGKVSDNKMHYSTKISTLVVSAVETEELLFGKYHLDLSRLLPDNLIYHRNDFQNFATSFQLHGQGTLNVSFGFKIVEEAVQSLKQQKNHSYNGFLEFRDRVSKQLFKWHQSTNAKTPKICAPPNNVNGSHTTSNTAFCDDEHNSIFYDHVSNVGASVNEKVMPSSSGKTSLASLLNSEVRVKSFHHIGECSSSKCSPQSHRVVVLGLDDKKDDNLECSPHSQMFVAEDMDDKKDDDLEFTVIEQGIEDCCNNRHVNTIVSEIVDDPCNTEAQEGGVNIEPHQVESDDKTGNGEHENRVLENEEDLIEDEFLSILEQGCCSSRKEEQNCSLISIGYNEHVAEPNFASPSCIDVDPGDSADLETLVQVAESEHQKSLQKLRSKLRARILEDAETEALMQKWGINDDSFEFPSVDDENLEGGFGSPIAFSKPLEKQENHAEKSNSVIPIGDGSLAEFVNPMLYNDIEENKENFHNTNIESGGLIMQLSKPVFLTTESSSDLVSLLQNLAGIGPQKHSEKSKSLMLLQDFPINTDDQLSDQEDHVSGQIVVEMNDKEDPRDIVGNYIDSGLLACRQTIGFDHVWQQKITKIDNQCNEVSSLIDPCKQSDCLEDIIFATLDKLEALAMEGLKIQLNMTDDENVPSTCNVFGLTESKISTEKRTREVEDRASKECLPCQSKQENLSADVLEEIDASTHNDALQESTMVKLSQSDKIVIHQICGVKKCSTVAMLIQLHDPCDNYKALGVPMLALIHVGNGMQPSCSQNAIIESTSTSQSKGEDLGKQTKTATQIRVTDVHVAGAQVSDGSTLKNMSTRKRAQGGSRWMIANGMKKGQNNVFQKLKKFNKTSLPSKQTKNHGGSVWSISSQIHGSKLDSYTRNPNII